jgi:hypothetical protein
MSTGDCGLKGKRCQADAWLSRNNLPRTHRQDNALLSLFAPPIPKWCFRETGRKGNSIRHGPSLNGAENLSPLMKRAFRGSRILEKEPISRTSAQKEATTMSTYTIGNYLAIRFEQIGLQHYFMVPGDYNLVLLDQLLCNKQVQQIGCCNELNAAYAAEGYARVKGAGAVITTFNVGAFSALIDHAILTALRERKPAYIEIACNLSAAPCPEPVPFEMLRLSEASNQQALDAAVATAATLLNDAKKPLLVAGVHLRAYGAVDAFRELAEALGCGSR